MIGYALIASVAVFAGIFALRRGPANVGITRTYATGLTQRATVLLDDGTRVVLAPQTQLGLMNFGARSRTVTLDGEAYFVVTRAAGVPFIVRSGATTTRVLGTSFLVRSYGRQVRVAVEHGKVGITAPTTHGAVTTLAAGDIADVIDSTVRVGSTSDLSPEIGWVDGNIVFRNTPVSDVLATLGRWYGYQFRYSDASILQQGVNVRLSTQSSADALSTLAQVLDVTLKASGDTITLAPRVASRRKSVKPTYEIFPHREVGR